MGRLRWCRGVAGCVRSQLGMKRDGVVKGRNGEGGDGETWRRLGFRGRRRRDEVRCSLNPRSGMKWDTVLETIRRRFTCEAEP